MSTVNPGTTIGSYQIEGAIGAGSMGDVYRGIDVHLNRRVAIKILSEKHRDSPELRARFVREGRAVAAISHPNVVQVFTTGVFDERPFIAMEFLDGTDLGTIIDEQGPLPSATAARMILDAARGLQAASRAGLIHRDVKPSNLVRLSDGRVKVTDFGLAKPVDPGSEPALTALGVVVGTPDYIAPEQARGDTIDERVDIYALGGTLYYLLIGTPPFRTGKPAEDKYLKVVARHLRQPAPDARQVRPEVDDELAELARLMMNKKPTDRPDYAQLIARLEVVVARLSPGGGGDAYLRAGSSAGLSGLVGKTPFVGGDSPTTFEHDSAGRDAGSSTAIPRGRRGGLPAWLIVLTGVSVLILAAGVAVYLLDRGAAGTTAPALDAAPAQPVLTVDAATAVVPAPPPEPQAPAGMALVKKPDGTPWFFVDRAPVRHGAYARIFPKQKKPSPALDDKPVVGVAYNFARAFADSTKRRLLTPEEYEAALATVGVEPAPAGTWEWVNAAEGDKRTVVAPGDDGRATSAKRPQTGQKDVTFRVAADLQL